MSNDDIVMVDYAGGTRMWYRNGVLHRDDGPAIEYASGTRMWFRNGKRGTPSSRRD